MPTALLAVDQLTISHGGHEILPPVSFHVFDSEIVALTGSSGSGKTSIALSILGLLPPALTQSGSITWNNELTWPSQQAQWPGLRGVQIGFIPQDVYGAFDPIMSIGQQLTLIVHDRTGKPKAAIESDLKQWMRETGLTEIDRLWKSFPHQLSGGQLQRCQICLAIALKPRLIIADEPTAAIDKINQQELLQVFASLREKYRIAILIITHDSVIVKSLADREVNIGSQPERPVSSPRPTLDHADEAPVLMVRDLVFTHRFGGLFKKEGATIGPVQIALNKGSCLGIVGESGSGKSTVGHLLVGLQTPDEGIITLHGKKIDIGIDSEREALRWKVQLIMQDGKGSLHPHHTILQILSEVLINKEAGYGHVQQRIEQVLDQVNLPHTILGRRPGTLSGGESLRVSIARALLMEPDVLICDEATSALDEPTRDSILSLLNRLKADHAMGLIVITHDMHVLRQLADEIMVMAGGRVVESGSARDVLQSPKHDITQKILTADATQGRKTAL